MQRGSIQSAGQALRFYRLINDPKAKAILDFLIDHPDERFEGADLVEQIGLSEHRDVARSTYRIGQTAADLDLQRPWTEGQRGYLMPGQQAKLLREAREQSETGPASS